MRRGRALSGTPLHTALRKVRRAKSQSRRTNHCKTTKALTPDPLKNLRLCNPLAPEIGNVQGPATYCLRPAPVLRHHRALLLPSHHFRPEAVADRGVLAALAGIRANVPRIWVMADSPLVRFLPKTSHCHDSDRVRWVYEVFSRQRVRSGRAQCAAAAVLDVAPVASEKHSAN